MSRKWDETSKPIRCADCINYDEVDRICTAKNTPIENKNGWRFCYLGEPVPFDKKRAKRNENDY